MEENKNNTEQQQEQHTMSDFCEALMNETSKLVEMRKDSDAAIILCTDGKTVASRQCGFYPTVLHMLYSKMISDMKFAEVVIEASMLYSRNMPSGKTYDDRPFKEDTPHADIKSFN